MGRPLTLIPKSRSIGKHSLFEFRTVERECTPMSASQEYGRRNQQDEQDQRHGLREIDYIAHQGMARTDGAGEIGCGIFARIVPGAA